jgi:hypothetical protein
MAERPVITIFRLTLDPINPTQLIAPVAINNVWLSTEDPSNQLLFYAIKNVVSSAFRVYFGVQYSLTAPKSHISEAGNPRWAVGDTIGWLLSSAGTGPAVITCFY